MELILLSKSSQSKLDTGVVRRKVGRGKEQIKEYTLDNFVKVKTRVRFDVNKHLWLLGIHCLVINIIFFGNLIN